MHAVKALHMIFMVTWFAGIFYLPRLYVYHAETKDEISNARFKIMERKLFWGITTPSAILTIIFGVILIRQHLDVYLNLKWMIFKLALVFLLVVYHAYLGKILYDFRYDNNKHSHVFYRWLNEVPVIFLVGIIFLIVYKPH